MSLLGACASTDAYRGNQPKVEGTLPERQSQQRLDQAEELGRLQGGAFGGLLARGVAKLMEPKDPATTPIAASASKTQYLEPVASASPQPSSTRTVASAKKTETTSDPNGTTYLAQ